MPKATPTASVSLDSLSQRMPAENFLVSAVFQLFHFLHAFLLGHTLTGSKFLLLFSIKSKEERLCFAVKVLNWRTSHLHQPPMIFLYLLRCPLRQILHRVQQLPIPINPIMQMRPCGKPRIPRFCHHLSLLDFLPLFHQYLRKMCI